MSEKKKQQHKWWLNDAIPEEHQTAFWQEYLGQRLEEQLVWEVVQQQLLLDSQMYDSVVEWGELGWLKIYV